MNSLTENLRNYLIVVNSSDYLQQLYKLCLEKLKSGCLVVLISPEFYDFSKLLDDIIVTKDQLKNFIIMKYNTLDDISRKLLLLHSWSLLPSMVAVDLSKLLSNELRTCSTSDLAMQKVTLCTVSLLAYLESIACQLTRIANAGRSSNTVYGLLILRKDGEGFGDVQIQTLRDLYFYKTGVYPNFDCIRTMMLEANEL